MTDDSWRTVEPDDGFEALVTDRLTIRRFEIRDVAAFTAYRSDPEVARYQGWDTPFDVEQARRFVLTLTRSDPDTPNEWFQFAVTETTSGQLLGDVAAGPEGDDHRLARIGFTLAPQAQGRGFATEAVTALLDYLFCVRGKHRVAAACDPRNLASTALLARVGMRREAHHLQSVWSKGEWTDDVQYAVLATEWSARRPASGG